MDKIQSVSKRDRSKKRGQGCLLDLWYKVAIDLARTIYITWILIFMFEIVHKIAGDKPVVL